jgi:phosphoglucosamine mutase
MSRRYFGTDGVRGTVGQAPITPEFVMKLGYAAGMVLANSQIKSTSQRPAVLIGKDTRISGYMLEAALEAGFSAAGVDVLMTGPLPTPGVAYLTRALRLAAGVVISASHNPFYDNGIKFFSAEGDKLPDAIELAIEAKLDEPMGCADSLNLGKAKRLEGAAERYIEFCKSTIPSSMGLRGLKIVVDAAHGAAYSTGPAVFHELGAEVVAVGNAPDGLNINRQVGATYAANLRQAVLEHKADIGVALDGDADRIVMCDAAGRIYDGDELLYIVVRDRLAASGNVFGAVGTLMTNFALEQAFAKLGIGFVRAKVGDRYVLEALKEKGWLYGGENSGHLLCLDRHTTGDGTISALQVLAAMQRTGKTMAELLDGLVLLPQTMINVKIHAGLDWLHHPELAQARKAAESRLGDTGRVLIRASGTEPLVRVMVEAANPDLARECAQAMATTLGWKA